MQWNIFIDSVANTWFEDKRTNISHACVIDVIRNMYAQPPLARFVLRVLLNIKRTILAILDEINLTPFLPPLVFSIWYSTGRRWHLGKPTVLLMRPGIGQKPIIAHRTWTSSELRVELLLYSTVVLCATESGRHWPHLSRVYVAQSYLKHIRPIWLEWRTF